MSLKEIWKDKVDGVDDILAEDINNIAQQSIQNADDISALNKSHKEEKENISANFDEVNDKIDSLNTNIETLNTKTDASDEEIDTLKERADGFDNEISNLNNRADSLSADLTTNFDEVNDRIDAETERVNTEFGEKADITYVNEKINEKAIEITKTANNSFANVLKGELNGAVVCVDDVSPVEHEIDVKVESKNLIPYPYLMGTQTINGVTFTVNDDGTVVANGTATKATYFALWYAESKKVGVYKGKRYTLSGCPAGGGSSTYQMACQASDHNIINLWDKGEGATAVALDDDFVKLLIYIVNGATVNNVEFKPMLSLSMDTEYTPYVSPDTVTVSSRYSKNLIPYPFRNTTKEANGLTFTDNGDGTITVNGTCTAGVEFILWKYDRMFMPKGCSYRLSGGLNLSSNLARIFIQYDNGTADTVGTITTSNWTTNMEGVTIIPNEDSYFHNMGLVVNQGSTFNNVTFKPMLELGKTTTEFEMYKGEEKYTANGDGRLVLNSISPNMTLIPDKAGVTLEVSYNKDTNKVIEQLTNAIISLGGNI